MADVSLQGLTVLVAEDEYLIATDLDRALVEAGMRVLGPVPSLAMTLELMDAAPRLDAAILDVNLQGEMVFPAATVLQDRGVPFVFSTGYDESVIPARFQHVTRCEKPVCTARLISALSGALAGALPHDDTV
jgi:CheY-like chemotaxis protein